MTDDLTLNMNAYLPLRDVVFNTLREAILKGDLKPGERLMELQLASKLGVSRTPIREAIRMLEQEGLAVTTPRKGAEVAKMTLKDMEDVLEIRDALDELAVRIACQKISDEQLRQLEDMKELFEKSDGLKVVVSAVYVGRPFPLSSVIIEIQHRCDSIYTKTVYMEFFNPEHGIRD